MSNQEKPTIEYLAEQQLEAYNRSDLDAFCGCYHSQVRVLDHQGNCLSEGIEAFRQRYLPLFTQMQFGADVQNRLTLNQTCIDDETWWRIDPRTQERSQGRVLVRYEEQDGLIILAQFFR